MRKQLATLFFCSATLAISAACDHTSHAHIYGAVRTPANAEVADALVVIRLDQPYGFYTWTNRAGEYSCPIQLFLGPLGKRPVTVRARDGSTTRQVKFNDDEADPTLINVTVTSLSVELPAAVLDSLDQQYMRCSANGY